MRQSSDSPDSTSTARNREFERLRKIFDYSHDAGFLIDPEEDRILDANRAACAMMGYSREELATLPISAMHPDEMPLFRSFAKEVMERGSAFTDELTCVTKEGDRLAAEISASPVEIDGRPCVIAWVRDIRARKEAEDALRESEARFRSVFDNAAVAIYMIETDGSFCDLNPKATEDSGFLREELLGTPLWDLSEGMTPEVFEMVVRQMENSGPVTISNTHRRKDGTTFPVEVRACLVDMGDRRVVLSLASDISDRLEAEQKRIELNRTKLQVGYLKEMLAGEHVFDEIVGSSPSMKQLFTEIDQVARTDATVLIVGETGTGKELVARALHAGSSRSEAVPVKVNCAALSAGLIESELFGHEKGAFTGATSQRIGRFELADNGTIFLDEIGDLSAELQAKLLRVLQEGEFERVGGTSTLKTDVRVLAATNQDLEKAVEEGRFRADLYYRLRVFPLHVPPLRERTGDIPLLAHYFLRDLALVLKKDVTEISPSTMAELEVYDWPGNVRELRNVIERAVITSTGSELELKNWRTRPGSGDGKPTDVRLDSMERSHILDVLERCSWQISGEAGAARLLGLKPTTLQSRMKKLDIRRPT